MPGCDVQGGEYSSAQGLANRTRARRGLVIDVFHYIFENAHFNCSFRHRSQDEQAKLQSFLFVVYCGGI